MSDGDRVQVRITSRPQPYELVVIIGALTIFVVVIPVVIVLSTGSVRAASLHLAAVVGGLVMVGTLVFLIDKIDARQLDRARVTWEPKLREWYALPAEHHLRDREIRLWLKQHRKGLSVDIAGSWARQGLAPPLASAAIHRDVGIGSVKELAAVLSKAGACDPTDRRAVAALIGTNVDLGREVPLPVIYEAVRSAVDRQVSLRRYDPSSGYESFKMHAAVVRAVWALKEVPEWKRRRRINSPGHQLVHDDPA